MVAIRCGDDVMVDLLIKYGADVNKTDADYNTPLILATDLGYIKIIQTLLNTNKILINQINDFDKTAYDYANKDNNIYIKNMLKKYGAYTYDNLKIKNKNYE
jgi:ankyrin repeat protein